MPERPYKVQVLNKHIRERNGAITHVGLKQALLGATKGHWKIIDERYVSAPPVSAVPVVLAAVKPAIKRDYGMVSILILALNNIAYTIRCVNSIRNRTTEKYQLVVVDNGSTDGTLEWLSKNLTPLDVLIRNASNKGFSEGNNQALKNAAGEFILMLNNDTEIQSSGWLDPFYKAIGCHDLVGPTIRKVVADPSSKQFIFAGEGTALDPWSYLEGWCLFGRKSTFETLGGLDERFSPAYSEDADLSFMAKHRGYRLGVANVPIVHFGSKTSAQLGVNLHCISEGNRKKLYEKWADKVSINILLRRHGAMGDVLMTTPTIRALRENHPTAKIVIETKNPQLLAGNPYLSKIVSTADPSLFDKVINLEYEKHPGEVRIDSMAKQAGVKLKSRKMEIFLPNVAHCLTTPYIVFHTGRTWPNREWALINFVAVSNYLAGRGFRIVQIGDDKTLSLPAAIDCRSKSWTEVAAIIKGAKAFIGVDSACSNLAKAVCTPAYIVYGCVNHNVMLADAVEYPLYVKNLPCFGCRDRSTAKYVECSKPKPYCLTRLTPKMVIKKIEETLK